MPMAIVLRSVPLVAMTPVIALIFGRGLLAVTVIAGIVTFFPVLVNVSLALRDTPQASLDLCQAYGAGSFTTLRKVQFPTALPALFASLRVAAPLALVGALLAEWLATGEGLGYLMLQSMTLSNYNMLWAATALVTVVLRARLLASSAPSNGWCWRSSGATDWSESPAYAAASERSESRRSPASERPRAGYPGSQGASELSRAFFTKSATPWPGARRVAAVPAAADVPADRRVAVVGGPRGAVPQVGVVEQHVAALAVHRRSRRAPSRTRAACRSVPPRCEPGTTRRNPFCGDVASMWMVNATDGHIARCGPDW